MEIRFLGSGDAFGSGGRYHTCFLATCEETRFLIDCGASSLIALKRFCSENLPLYMIPDQFTWCEALPKTSTDKVDYQRLKEMA